MKKTRKAPVTVTLKLAALRPSQLATIVTGGGHGEAHTNDPAALNITHRVQPS